MNPDAVPSIDVGARHDIVWGEDDDELRLDGVPFEVRALGPAHVPDRLRLMKPRPMIERYIALLGEIAPARIVELGIYQGGSTAFLAHLLRPEKLVAVDRTETPVALLDAFLVDHGYEDTVRPYYGVDQADAATVGRILDDELDGHGPDLVIDDASHDLHLTRASFDILFPRLRPGGLYIIEDWAWGLFPFSPPPTRPSLSVFVYEVILTLPYAPDLVAEVTVNEHWAVVRKAASAPPDPPWSIDRAYSDYGHRIVEGATRGAQPAG